jgi:hypothetical protein
VAELLQADMLSNPANLGCTDLSRLSDHLVPEEK